MRHLRWFVSVLLLVVFCVFGSLQTANAAITPSGDADPYYPGPFGWPLCVVGNSGTGSLIIDNGSVLDSFGGSLGVESSASGTVTVTDSGSTWTNALSLSIGCEGTGTLNITNGGVVTSSNGYVGYGEISTGLASVSGAGSLWTCENLNIGDAGSGTLNITTGGFVNSEGINLGNDPGSTGIVTVNGDNTTLTASSSLRVGYSGCGTLEILDGGTVNTSTSYIGSGSDSTGLVTVNGNSSTWINTDDLYIGHNGNGTLNIINGGAVTVGGMTELTHYEGSTGAIHFDNGVLTAQSLWATQDQLTGTGTVNVGSFGTLLSDRNIVFNATTGPCYTTLLENQTNQHVTVNVDMSTSNADLYVGYASNGSLTISEANAISCKAGYLGYLAGSSGTVNVTGENSQLTVDGENTENRYFYVGYNGNGTLNITNGGNVVNKCSSHLGSIAGSSGSVTVNGTDSKWTSGSLYVGYRGSGDLEITGGGEVTSGYGYINYLSSSPSSVTVNGEGSKWTTSSTLYVGHRGTGSLVVSAGGEVTSSGGSVGYRSSEISSATITGPGSKWINSSGLGIGGSSCYSGHGSLEIANGGFVSSTTGSIGTFTNSTGSVIVTGENSTWTINCVTTETIDLNIGNSGIGTLEIADGGTVSNRGTRLGGSTLGSSATVTGTGSTWTIAQDFHIGGNIDFDGHGTLNIANGGQVNVGNMTWLSLRSDSTGSIHFDNGTLSTKTLCASLAELTGTGTIHARGLVTDGDLMFDSAGDTVQSFIVENQPGEQVTVNLDLSNPSDVGILGVGYKDSGTLTISQGVTVNSLKGWLGHITDSLGTATITGEGSTWNINEHLYVGGNSYVHGRGGDGILEISNGGSVTCGACRIGETSTSTGLLRVVGAGSTLTANAGISVGSEGIATLEILDGASVTNLVNSCHIAYGSGSVGRVTVTGNGSTWNNSRQLTIGQYGCGTLEITNGGTASCDSCIMSSSGTGSIEVAGHNSSFVNAGYIYLGYNRDATLEITDGGSVTNSDAYIAYNSGSTSWATVEGAGSTWTNNGDIIFGYTSLPGTGTLNIAGGGAVTAGNIDLRSSKALLSIAVGGGSNLTINSGTGTFTNDGTVRIMAGVRPGVGSSYSPIAAGTWSGGGVYQALGGTWDENSHVFTASMVANGVSGSEVSIDLVNLQRVLVEDSETGWSLGASLLAMDSSTTVGFTATVIDETLLDNLTSLLSGGDYIQSGWDFSVAGYGSEDPAYLSLNVETRFSRGDLTVWYHDGTGWTEYDAIDLTCGDGYASFTVTGSAGVYAVTGVPEPASAALLLGLAATMLLVRKRSRM